MRFLSRFQNELVSNLDSFFYRQEEDKRLPKQYGKIKLWLQDLAVAVFGEDHIIEEHRITGEKDCVGHTLVVCFDLERPMVGIDQTRIGEQQIQTYYCQMTLRYIKSEEQWDFFRILDYGDSFNIWDGVMKSKGDAYE